MATEAYSVANLYKMEKTMEKLDRIKERVYKMQLNYQDSVGQLAEDDFITKELFLIVDQEYFFVFRSQDVIHCAYFPHFRLQMNCVPGQRTHLKLKPIFTTEQMKEKTGNPNFEYILMCNKICGESHSMMKMAVRVGTLDEYNLWKADATNATMFAAGRTAPPATAVVQKYSLGERLEVAGDHGTEEDSGEEGGH